MADEFATDCREPDETGAEAEDRSVVEAERARVIRSVHGKLEACMPDGRPGGPFRQTVGEYSGTHDAMVADYLAFAARWFPTVRHKIGKHYMTPQTHRNVSFRWGREPDSEGFRV